MELTKIKKVGAAAASVLMMGATLGMAATLGDYPSPFITNGEITSQIVVGSQSTDAAGLASDIAGAINIAASLGNAAIKTETKTKEVATSGTGAGYTVTNGKELDTANTKIYFGDDLSTKTGIKNTLTSSDLPTILPSQTFTDDSGTNYNYDQYINFRAGTIRYSTSGGDLSDPVLILNTGYSTGSPLYDISVVFNKLWNVSDSNVQGNTIEFLGNTYTVGSGSAYGTTTKKVELFGSANAQTISEGEEITVELNGVEHTIGCNVVSGTTTAAITVDGTLKVVTKQQSYVIAGVNIYVDEVVYGPKESQVSSVRLSIGSQKIILEDGSAVKVGQSEDTVDGTLVTLTGTANEGISKINIAVTGKDSSNDYILKDGAFVDPVFGTFKVAFGGLFTGTTDAITVDNSGNLGATLKFTDYRGNEKTITWAQTPTTWGPQLNWTSTNQFHVVEGETIRKNDYLLLSPSQESEFSHIFKYRTASGIASSGAYIELDDVMSGQTLKIYLTQAGNSAADFYVDGQEYHVVSVDNNTQTMKFTWGTGSAAGDEGTKTMIYPLIKAKGGEWIALTTNVTIDNATTYELPTNTSFSVANFSAYNGAKTYGRVTYYITPSSASAATLSLADASGTRMGNPTVMVLEEKAKDTSNSEVKDAIIVTIRDAGTTSAELTVNTPSLTAATKDSATWQSDASVTGYYDRRGTYVKYDSDGQGLVEITYPDEQAVAGIAVGPDPTFTAAGGGGTVTVEYTESVPSAVPDMALVDSDTAVATAKTSKNLILVGGPAVNSLVAELASDESSGVWNLDTWRDGAHANMAQIVLVNDAFTTGKAALVVAGYEKENTRMACLYMKNYKDYASQLTAAGTSLELTGTTLPTVS